MKGKTFLRIWSIVAGLPSAGAHSGPVKRLPSHKKDDPLVIARTIVEAHGGRLWAGAAARGASVRFYLPATASTGV